MGDEKNTTSTFAVRLKQARTMKGLSLRELAAATADAVSYNAISRYENGVMMPESGNLAALARALDQPTDFFFRPAAGIIGNLAFRKLARLKGKAEESVRAQIQNAAERLLELEDLVGVTTPFYNPLANTAITTEAEARAEAAALRQHWQLGQEAIPALVALLEDKGVKVAEIEAAEDFSGVSGWIGAVPFIVLQKSVPIARKRFTAAHELAHLLLESRIPESIEGKAREGLIDSFAGAFLIPAEVAVAQLGVSRTGLSIKELEALKARYGVSIMALVRQARDAGIVSAKYYSWFQIKNKTATWRKTGEPGDDRVRYDESCHRLERLLWRALEEEAISHSKAASLLGVKVSELWKKLQASE
jgi:Zn-dependent peptidase ImmA (M78 family)